MQKTVFLALGVALLLVVGFYAFNAYIYAEKQGDGTVEAYRGTLSGEVVCLPHADKEGPQTMECALGLHTDTGEYYALDLSLLSQQQPMIDTGKRITATGLITPVELLNTDHWKKYEMEGIFSVTDAVSVE